MQIQAHTQIKLNRFKARPYQLPILDAIENKGYKRVLAILPRRAGKDVTAFNLCIRQCLRKICVVYYIFPTYSQAKKVIWDSVTNDGDRILDYIPDELIESKNSQEMKIRFKNGSLLQLVGSDNYDSLMGTNPQGVVFSEYALQDPRAYQYIRPILVANDGWALFISTPRGKNHLWELYNIATNSDDWFAYKLSVSETGHIDLESIERERADGLMSEDLIQQEYFCSFELGVEGAYYAKYLDKMRMRSQIGQVPWEAGFPVHTAWDIGVRDHTTVVFFQTIGMTVRIIDCYSNSKQGLEHYVNVLKEKPYTYGKHIAPHDIKVKEFGTGITRLEKARQLGIIFTVAANVGITDGIEAVRTMLSKVWIDEFSCKELIKALENYRQEFDARHKVYKGHPLHDWSSHFCFTGDTLVLTRNGMRQIMYITDKDEVMTLSGWKRCTNAMITQRNATLVEVMFKDGTTVRCTPGHLFLTAENEWKSARELKKGIEIQSSWMKLPNTLMDHYTDYGSMRNIFQRVDQDSTGMYGKMLSDQYQKIVIYITEILIPLITTYGILNASIQENIENFLSLIAKDFQMLLEKKQMNGTNLRQEDYGIRDMRKDQNLGPNGNEEISPAKNVERALKDLLEKMDDLKSSAIPIVKPLIIESIVELDYKENVWDISVTNRHFSLSNGAIVHNCDSVRYMAVSLPKTRDSLSPEELDKRYNEAVYGIQSNMPSVFRTDLPDNGNIFPR